MTLIDYLKNPIIFGVLVGIIMCILLFIHDKMFRKPEDKSKFSTYFKIFLAGWISSAPLVWLFFNKDISFKKSKRVIIQNGGNIDEVVKKVVEDNVSINDTISSENIKRKPISKKCHLDDADW